MAANVNAVACKRPNANASAAGAPPPPPPMHKKCSVDEHGCVCLSEVLTSFNAPLSEEQAWALCFECARCFERAVQTDREACYLVEKVDHVFIHKDGLVHNKTILGSRNNLNSNNQENGRTRMSSERKLVESLGITIFDALDFGLQVEEERLLSPDLKRLILAMAACDDEDGHTERSSSGSATEADDEGIERDSGENDEESHLFTLSGLIKSCSMHLGVSSAHQADVHYRAVCRALVAEALELSSFLEVVSRQRQPHLTACSADMTDAQNVVNLDQLKFADWARLWGQVIRELRHGVQLKKVHYSRAPVEFELTPYEILMEDIRARRYTLNKVGCALGDIPHTVKKDAHALILEFIRSRPPLRRCADRPLPPLVRVPTPREQLMDSIIRGKTLRPTPARRSLPPMNGYSSEAPELRRPNGLHDTERKPMEKKRITVDFELLKVTAFFNDQDVPVRRIITPTSGGGFSPRTPFIVRSSLRPPASRRMLFSSPGPASDESSPAKVEILNAQEELPTNDGEVPETCRPKPRISQNPRINRISRRSVGTMKKRQSWSANLRVARSPEHEHDTGSSSSVSYAYSCQHLREITILQENVLKKSAENLDKQNQLTGLLIRLNTLLAKSLSRST